MSGVDPYAAALADAVEEAVPAWVERSVARVLAAAGRDADPDVLERAADAGRRARDEVMERLRPLLDTDIDDQRSTPLTILRDAVRFPTEVLRNAGVPPVERDHFAARAFPDDVYDLTPASFADVDPSLQEPGIVWGASKAHAHLQRHKGPA